jgi:hypothetical protein
MDHSIRTKTIVLALLLCLFTSAAGTLAHRGESSAGTDELLVVVHTDPEPLEAGLIQLRATVYSGDELVRGEPVLVELYRDTKTILSMPTSTDEEGTLAVAVYIESAGYYDFALTARGERVVNEVHVHGRLVLVTGFLVSLAILLALLLDRL